MKLLLLAIDMVLVYLIFAILVSGIQEWIAQRLAKRGTFLFRGLSQLIGDSEIFEKVVSHPLIAGTGKITVSRTWNNTAAKVKPPSYIDPQNLALALAQVLITPEAAVNDPPQRTALTFASLREALAKQDTAVSEALLPILDCADQDLHKAIDGIQDWYARGMDRVSGWYKAYAQWRLFWIGLIVAALANVNSIAIFEALNSSPELAQAVASQASPMVNGRAALTPDQSHAIVDQTLSSPIAGLPIGFGCLSSANRLKDGTGVQSSTAKPRRDHCGDDLVALVWTGPKVNLLFYLLGCALTALAGTLGAPFWFAALADLLRIRGSGPTPSSRQSTK